MLEYCTLGAIHMLIIRKAGRLGSGSGEGSAIILSLHPNDHLPKILLVPVMRKRLSGLVEAEDALIHHGLDVFGLDGRVHLLELRARPDQDAAYDAAVGPCVEHGWLLSGGFVVAAEEADDGNNAFVAHRGEALGHGVSAADFEDMADADVVGGEVLGGGAPVWVGGVVDNVVDAEGFKLGGFGGGGGGGDDGGAGGHGELDGRQGDTTSALG